jgi:hypothetical protein
MINLDWLDWLIELEVQSVKIPPPPRLYLIKMQFYIIKIRRRNVGLTKSSGTTTFAELLKNAIFQ